MTINTLTFNTAKKVRQYVLLNKPNLDIFGNNYIY